MNKLWNPKIRRIGIFLSALIISGVIVLIAVNMVNSSTETEKVVVVTENIGPNQNLKGMLKYRDVVKSELPSDPVRNMDDVEGKNYYTSAIGFYKDQPISKSGITTSAKSTFGETLDLKKPNHFVGIKVDQSQATGSFIKPGVIVDAVAYIKADGGSGRVIGPDDDPDLAGLVVVGRENSEGTEPGQDGRSSLTSLVIVNAPTISVYKKLVQYQEDGKIYLGPAGVKTK
ncbi:SAF domain-containing protein [Paenibacillus sp. S33]|uniref:SAF domain-containing protein n=1 Tax=Paenibacillus sp. A3M_27_13 TaxID=2962029 RepID=UPI0020B66BD8|nr:SAF domain-containing protein [Paenibacillus sp. A3M_27_13]MCP3746669.1 SAF domain-containing protein [Paenibacillus sp. A3M_27_13]